MGEENYPVERMARLETKFDYVIEAIDRLDKNLQNNYVPRQEIEKEFATIKEKVDRLEKELGDEIQRLQDKHERELKELKSAPKQLIMTWVAILSLVANGFMAYGALHK